MQNRISMLVSKLVLVTGFMLAASAGVADEVKIGTLNAAWLMDQEMHARWVSACQTVSGKSGAEVTQQQKTDLAGLPYCNVHSGIKYDNGGPCGKIEAELQAKRPSSAGGKCRQSKDLFVWEDYLAKIEALRSMVELMARSGVTMIAFQEVSSSPALSQILPPNWKAYTSHDAKEHPNIPQHVGIAWLEGKHDPKGFGLLRELEDGTTRPLRPGLTFTDNILGKPTELLVVHLKSGCPTADLTKLGPQPPKVDTASGLAQEPPPCRVLRAQTNVIEAWIDARVGRDFMLIGDFNRRMALENEEPTKEEWEGKTHVKQMFPEWNDDQPPGSKIVLIKGETCGEHKYIDNVILSASLNKRVKPGEMKAQPIILNDNGKPFIASFTSPDAAPTYHCGFWLSMLPR